MRRYSLSLSSSDVEFDVHFDTNESEFRVTSCKLHFVSDFPVALGQEFQEYKITDALERNTSLFNYLCKVCLFIVLLLYHSGWHKMSNIIFIFFYDHFIYIQF